MDPFLFSCQHPGLPVFDLAHGLSTVAVRDQMVRGKLLADRLAMWLPQQNGNALPTLPVLVVGAGAAGLTTAMTLANAGLQVVCCDVAGAPFEMQRNGGKRWLCPTQYDWPLDHWRGGAFGFPAWGGRVPLPWTAGPVQGVRQGWIASLVTFLRKPASRLRVLTSTFADIANAGLLPNGAVAVRLQPGGMLTCCAVVLAFGFGEERNTLKGSPDFISYRFWESDPFEEPYSGLPSAAHEGNVVVCGGGDGGAQDLLRILTRKRSVREILQDLQLHAGGIDLRALHSAEHRAERAVNWTYGWGSPFVARYLDELGDVHRMLAQEALRADPGLSARILQLTADRPRHTSLVTDTDYLTCGYALNRFLVTLLLEVLEPRGSVTWHRKARVTAARTSAPPATVDAASCLGGTWDVEIGNSTGARVVQAGVLVLRIGSTGNAAIAPGPGGWLPPRPPVPMHMP